MRSKAHIATSASVLAMTFAAATAAGAQNIPATPPALPDPTAPAPPSTAQSDQNAAVPQTEVIVTGVRQSVLSAQKLRRDSDKVVDSVVAEDIGKLPDDNVAEALQRVTGVQITRNQDEGVAVLIRGLPNVVTLLNGRELFTTTGRYVALADVPAAFLQRVDVYKSNSADQLEGGIAGTIDVRTHRPFDFKGSELSATGRLVYSNLSDKLDPNIGVLASDRWMTGAGEVGALVGVSYQERHYRNEIIDNYVSDFIGTQYGPSNTGQQTISGDRRRPAADFALQWRPNSELEFYTEGFFTEDQNRTGVDFFVGLPRLGAITGTTTYPGTNLVKTLNTTGTFSIASTQATQIDSQTYQLASGGAWTHEQLKVSGDLSYTHSIFKTRNAILDTSFTTPSVFADFNYQGSGTPYLSYTGINLEDPTNFSLFQLFDNHGRDSGESITGRLDASYTFTNSPLKSIEAGFRGADRTAKSNSTNPSPQPYAFGAISAASIPGLEGVSPSGFFDGDAAVGVSRFATPNADFLLNSTNTLRALLPNPYQGPVALDPSRFFSDREVTYSGYLQARGAYDFASIPLDGVAGLRFVQTDQTLRGFNVVTTTDAAGVASTTTTPLAATTSTFDVLPSLNVRARLPAGLQARFAYNRTITRPDFAALNPAVSLTSPGATLLGSGTGGNPNLQEVKSDNLDWALEWYFARTGSLTATAFLREIDGYIQSYAANETIGGRVYAVTRPNNTGSGELKGVEIGYTQFYDFAFMPDWTRGFGLQLNFTYIDGTTQSPGATPGTFGPDQQLVGVSRYSLNAIGLYERGPYSARVAYNWRSRYTDSYNNAAIAIAAGEPASVVVSPIEQLDMTFGYKLSPKATLTFDWVNALDSIYQDSFGNSPYFPRDTRRFDTTYELGFRWSL